MKLCSFELSGDSRRLGVYRDDGLADLTSVDPGVFGSIHTVYAEAARRGLEVATLVAERIGEARSIPDDQALLRIPVVPSEIWAAGVTYLRSREARESETKTKGLYDHVYSAPRPELFVKDSGLRCRGPGEEVCVRSDSNWSVPEPELAVLLDENAKTIGYTCGNDLSSRDIEGENALYLPQAKVYTGSSSIGPVITTADEITNPHALWIKMKIFRGGRVAFEGQVNTSKMKRSVDELVGFLKKDNTLGRFTVLLTGTAIVPPDEFTLSDGDLVEVEIERIGVLRNPVRRLR